MTAHAPYQAFPIAADSVQAFFPLRAALTRM